jgi:ankyrin repeat protein
VEALQRISSHPREVFQIGIQRRAPIHLACDHDAPAFLVQSLMNLWPGGAFMVGTSYMNPLHITCSSQNASNEIVQLLVSGCGDPLRITSAQDIDGDTPLHAACRCAAPIDVLATLLQINPATVFVHDYECLNPILRLWVRYYVVLGEPAISGIQSASDLTPQLVEAWQKSLLLLRVMDKVVKLNGGQGPTVFRAVHCASLLECPRCVLRISMILYPDQIYTSDEHGRLPLHIATKAPVYVSHIVLFLRSLSSS